MQNNTVRFQTAINPRYNKVLIVENDEAEWLLIRQATQVCLPKVIQTRASSVEEALHLLGDWENQEWELPKLVLLNLYLPTNEDGWRLLKTIKQMPTPFKSIPIIIFSVSDDATDVMTSYNLGASSYIVKPSNLDDWLALFDEMRSYWWEIASLPPIHYR